MNRLPRRSVLALLGAAPLAAWRPATATPIDWSDWGDAAWQGAQDAVRAWQAQARFRDVLIQGSMAHGGRVAGPSLKTLIKAKMQGRGAPDDAADRFAAAVAEPWKLWHEALRVPGLPWYPAFASFPGAKAVPTPNTPTPLAALTSPQAPQLLPPALKARIVAALGALAHQPGAALAAEQFAQRFGTRFAAWQATVMVAGVVGSGPVPSYRPPRVPAGPVVGGSVADTPGGFAAAARF